MTSKGVELRAQIDMENAKGLLLINGGGAVAVLAFIPHIIDKADFAILFKIAILALAMFQFGLFFAVLHNFFAAEMFTNSRAA